MWNDYSVVVEEEQMDYAVVLYMNEEKTAMVKEWIKELAPVCGSDYCLNAWKLWSNFPFRFQSPL